MAKKDGASPKRFSSRITVKSPVEAEAVFVARLRKSAVDRHWVKSALTGTPLDESGAACPWYTYPALHFLTTRDVAALRVFEYGSGASTLWWAQRARQVVSVEHSRKWFDQMRLRAPPNVTFVFRELVSDGDYAREILNHEESFDIVVIDGRDRVNCVRHAISRLRDHAAIVWDNSNRTQYAEGFALLEAAGYRRIDFAGYGPVNPRPWMTSVFYKSGNCLGL